MSKSWITLDQSRSTPLLLPPTSKKQLKNPNRQPNGLFFFFFPPSLTVELNQRTPHNPTPLQGSSIDTTQMDTTSIVPKVPSKDSPASPLLNSTRLDSTRDPPPNIRQIVNRHKTNKNTKNREKSSTSLLYTFQEGQRDPN